MKIEGKKELHFENNNKSIKHDCEKKESFSQYLEKSLEKQKDELLEKQESEEINKTSIFAEKKVGKRKTDIFDTLIDI